MEDTNKETSFFICQSKEDFETAKTITKDYMQWLGMDLSFQNIDNEFNVFEKMYAKPEGCFIFALYEGKIAGGVGLRKLEEGICEMKRLYVYDDFQGKGIGKLLCNEIISISKSLGYSKMRLDTVSKLKSANKLYDKIGFKEIPKYRKNPDETARFMELEL